MYVTLVMSNIKNRIGSVLFCFLASYWSRNLLSQHCSSRPDILRHLSALSGYMTSVRGVIKTGVNVTSVMNLAASVNTW